MLMKNDIELLSDLRPDNNKYKNDSHFKHEDKRI